MTKNQGRVVGLDVHPDSFAGAVVAGSDPARAQVLSTSTRVELERLEHWALCHTTREDTLVLEASGNAFAVAARLRVIGRQVEILESHRAGKIGKLYCANDRVDALKIARIYLSALSPIVWQPDPKTLERREVFSAYQAVVKESTRAKQQLRSMLNEHCVRFGKRLPPLSPKGDYAPAKAAGVDAVAHNAAATVARQPGLSASTAHCFAPTHGPGDRGR
jgi:transposase